jgi:hypothetical protein
MYLLGGALPSDPLVAPQDINRGIIQMLTVND